MKKLCLILSGYILIGLICYSRLIQAHGYIPAGDGDNAGILSAGEAASPREMMPLAELAVLLEREQRLDQDKEISGKLRHQIEHYYRQEPGIQSAYLYARVLQREHKFARALSILTTLLETAPQQINARLLQASIFMVQGSYHQAKQSCLALTGHIALTIVAICALDADSQRLGQQAEQQEQLKRNYQSLIHLLAADKPSGQGLLLWADQVLAEMALRLNRPLAAQRHLRGITLSRAPVSLLALWADIELALGHEDSLLITIPDLLAQTQAQLMNLPDALLLRLAIAEQKSHGRKAGTGQWQNLMAERVRLREVSRNHLHAALLARYYLDVYPDINKAKHWAAVNFQQTKMASDRSLFFRALTAEASGAREEL
ncbi:hypothetical protein [Thalassomonas haliotis]|uniref:Uncharacterized protein n=1 Tax=Thalassomonas haliotis TaxID=485448 RepID=A0ABY7VKL0_9GAMM|nr:hypothetical protein [Thalassomonas haliotis]WDE14282.1 hypothetical protein H3N35_13185 [Thalassomonas haliotis]